MTPSQTRLATPQFLLAVTANFAVFASFGVSVIALPLYARDALAASDLGVGIAVGVSSITSIIFGPVSGRLGDRRGRRAVLLAGAALILAAYLALALEPPLAVVVAARLVAGAGEAAFVVAAFTVVTDLAPEDRRGEAVSLISVGSYAGLTIGPLLGDVVLGDGRFTAAWLVAAGFVAAAGVLGLAVRETRSAEEEAPRGWLPPRAALVPGLLVLFALLGFGGYVAFAALYAREIGLDRPGVAFALFGAVVVAVRLFGRRLPDRLGAAASGTLACALIAAGLLTVASWPSIPGLLVGTAVFAVGQALAYPAAALLAMARAPASERSAALGSVAACVDIALAAGAFVLGAVAEAAGYRAVFVAGAASAVVGLVLARTSAAREPQRAELQ